MKLLMSKDFISGLLLLAIGIVALYVAQSYRLGTAGRMGPGYFPTMLAIGLAGLGTILMLGAWRSADPVRVDAGSLRAVVFPTLGLIVFGLTLPVAGLVVALALLLGIGVIGSSETRWKEVVFLIIGAIVFAVVVFVHGVGLQVKVWPV